jgi:uncharacterized protein (DUF1684 family)
MKHLLTLLLTIYSLTSFAQLDSAQSLASITAFQKGLNEEYKDRAKSPLEPKDFKKFKGHEFFPANLKYRVNAKLIVSPGTPFFGMKTTTSRLAKERVYGHVEFILDGKQFRLPVYQSEDLMKTEEHADYLFFPFSDETNGKETYGGGRYIDLRIPKEGDDIIVDFNMAYNPLCAYSPRYSCPKVPAENQMDIEVKAGVKYKEKKKH